jgi:hypothetical protein
MTEAEWLACTDPAPMLGLLHGKASERKLRLFACAFARLIIARVYFGDVVRWPVETAERYADGLASLEELWSQHSQTRHGVRDMQRFGFELLGIQGEPPRDYLLAARATEPSLSGLEQRLCDVMSWKETVPLAPVLLREIFGNPFRPGALDATWLTPTVTGLATAAYDERALPSGELDRQRLAVLADGLEDAGCADADLLGHLRGDGPHVRGCWAVDRILARS